MSESRTEDALELEVSDFGPIVKAKVDLRPLTVFVGPSNTGKSYLAILVYALHKAFHAPKGDPLSGTLQQGVRNGPPLEATPHLSEEMIKAILDEVGQIYGDTESLKPDQLVLRPPITDAIRRGIEGSAYDLCDEIERCFGFIGPADLARWDSHKPARVVIRRQATDQAIRTEHSISIALEPEFNFDIPSTVSISVDSISEGIVRQLSRSQLHPSERGDADPLFQRMVALDFLSQVSGLVLPSLVGPLCLPAYYLPADRAGIMHAHSVVVRALVADASTAKRRSGNRSPTLSGVLGDFLQDMIDLDETKVRKKAGGDLGESIEKRMLGGSICIGHSNLIDYPHFAYRPNRGDELTLANSSSMISELAPVVLYLRHMVEPGNVLIVEEPESHLHPAMQVEFTRQLAAIVKAGVRVIVTTHSEWLLEELANIVRRSKVDDDGSGGIGLQPDQVGAWLFEPKKRPKGSMVKEITLDESGLFPSGYAAVAEALHNDWADISSQMKATS